MVSFRSILACSSLLMACLATSASAQWYQGPSGGAGGQSFDGWAANQHATNIRDVLIDFDQGSRALTCLAAQYPNQPSNPTGPTSGANPPNCNPWSPGGGHHSVPLDPDEYILGVSGTYTDRITSLRFYTNKKNSPVFGDAATGQIFGYTAPRGQMIVAFTETSDSRLRSIGVMYAPCNSAIKSCK